MTMLLFCLLTCKSAGLWLWEIRQASLLVRKWVRKLHFLEKCLKKRFSDRIWVTGWIPCGNRLLDVQTILRFDKIKYEQHKVGHWRWTCDTCTWMRSRWFLTRGGFCCLKGDAGRCVQREEWEAKEVHVHVRLYHLPEEDLTACPRE